MKNKFLTLIVITGFITLASNESKAWIHVEKSGFGLFGYAHPVENRWSYQVNGVTVCAAELLCNGGGFNSCKWSTPLTSCELAGIVTITQNPTVDQEFADFNDNMLLYQVSALVDDKIQNGNTHGTIIYIENHMITYNQSADGKISFNIYEKQEAINLGIWPL